MEAVEGLTWKKGENLSKDWIYLVHMVIWQKKEAPELWPQLIGINRDYLKYIY